MTDWDPNAGLKKKGMRVIKVSGELMAMFLRGETLAADPIDLPKDTAIIGTVKAEQNMVAILCGSDEWEGSFDSQGRHLEFLPTFLAKGATCDGRA